MRLRHVVQVNPLKSLIRHLPGDTEVTFAPMEALADGLGGLNVSETRSLAEVKSGSYNYFTEGDLLLAKVTPCFENGKKAIARHLTNGIGFATSEVYVVRLRSEAIDRRYLNYVFCSEPFRASGMASMTGAGGLRRVSEEAILNYQLPIVDREAQKHIANFLDRETARIDHLIEKKRWLLDRLREKRRTITIQCFLEGLQGFDWLSNEQSIAFRFKQIGWVDMRVKSVVNFMTSGSRGWSDFLGSEGELFIQSGNIGRQMEVDLDSSQRVQPRTGAEAERTLIKKHDVLVCITGGRTGAVGYVHSFKERAYINQHVCLLRARCNTILPELLAHIYSGQRSVKSKSSCASMASSRVSALGNSLKSGFPCHRGSNRLHSSARLRC